MVNGTRYSKDIILSLLVRVTSSPIEKNSENLNFWEWGLDSLKSIEFKYLLQKQYPALLSLEGFNIFKCHNLDELIHLLEEIESSAPVLQPLVSNISASFEGASLEQVRVGYVCELYKELPLYNIGVAMLIEGTLESDYLKEACQVMTNRHEVLRAYFESEEKGLLQKVLDQGVLLFQTAEFQDEKNYHSKIKEEFKEVLKHKFDLRTPPLCQFKLLKFNAETHGFIAVFHHLIMDGWSIRLFFNEVMLIYRSLYQKKTVPFTERSALYREFSYERRAYVESPAYEAVFDYWMQRLQGMPENTVFVEDKPRTSLQHYQSATFSYPLEPNLISAIKKMSIENSVSVHATWLTLFLIFIYKCTAQSDLVIGGVSAGRDNPQYHNTIGFFSYGFPFRFQVNAEHSFLEMLPQVFLHLQTDLLHKPLVLERLLTALNLSRTLNRTPFYQMAFIHQNFPALKYHAKEIKFTPVATYSGDTLLDMELELNEFMDNAVLEVKYNANLFLAQSIQHLVACFNTFVLEVIKDPSQAIKRISLLSEEEKKIVLFDWQNTFTEYPREKSIIQLFEEQVALYSTQPAVIFENREMTYAELNARANLLASTLHCVEKSYFLVYLDRSIEFIIAILAVLKVGGTYVPLAVGWPQGRLSEVIKAFPDDVILTSVQLKDQIASLVRGKIIEVDQAVKYEPSVFDAVQVNPEGLACVLYTSGSTGTPKGVMISQKAIIRLVRNQNVMSIHPGERMAHASSEGFDTALFEIWGALLNGGALVIIKYLELLSATKFKNRIIKDKIDIMLLTTSLFNLHFDDDPQLFDSLRILSVVGETLDPKRTKKFVSLNKKTEFMNGYGPTEGTAYTTYYSVKSPEDFYEKVPVGKPVANTQVYILDNDLQPVPIGVPGEIYIGGEGLALGYYGNPKLTGEKFLSHPFIANQKIYKTGDRGRFLLDGNIEFLGRMDSQIKIRGFRIEISEIEWAIKKLSEVKEAVVVLVSKVGEEKYLVAYCLLNENAKTISSQIGARLKQDLPPYMQPKRIEIIDKFPLTSSGKIDRRALSKKAELIKEEDNERVEEDENATEKQLKRIWVALLGIQSVPKNENFFDLGGHSLLLAKLQREVNKIFGIDIPMAELFSLPTIERMASYINGRIKKQPEVFPVMIKEDDIAVIGLSGRFPGAENIQQFWENIAGGKETISFFSDQELLAQGIESSVLQKTNYVKAKGFLKDIDLFDPHFFNMNALEASVIDPQQRVLMELSWEALEDAGYVSEEHAGKIGVFYGGASHLGYLHQNVLSNSEIKKELSPYQLYTSNLLDLLSTRISYKLNLTGPSYTLSTACSTSLVAVVVACQNLLSRNCDLALAGGICITYPQKEGYLYQQGMILSPDGHCKAFSDQAAGTVLGNASGVVVLKRLSEALSAGDHIYAVIKGSAINNDGANKIGFTAPSVEGQKKVIQSALQMAKAAPETITYIEAHGTGTPLGDPIEINALTDVYGSSQQKCAVGSVKTNIGHCDTAAGIAGFIKTVLSLHHKKIPPTLHFSKANPEIDFSKTPFYVNTELKEWASSDLPRRAGISSFGIGGTNAHVVIEEAPVVEKKKSEMDGVLILLSAKSSTALQTMRDRLLAYLIEYPEVRLSDVAFTLQHGRTVFPYRYAFVCRDRQEAIQCLQGNEPESFLPLKTYAEKWVKGETVDWDTVNQYNQGHRISLPTYPFERKKCWVDPDPKQETLAAVQSKDKNIVSEESVEEKVLGLIKKVLVLDRLSLEDNFFDKGGDSLMAIQLATRLSDTVGISVSADIILQANNVDDMIQNIKKEISRVHTPISSLMKLKTGESDRSPLFLIHPVGGTVFIYRQLAKMISVPVTIYGIQAQSLDGVTSPELSVEAMAKNYIHMMKEVQKEGPYQLAGLSFGGTIAYEMAQQLAISGEQVSFLTLIDTPGPEALPKMFSDDAEIMYYFLHQLFRHDVSLEYLRELTPPERMQYLVQHVAHPAFEDNLTSEKMVLFIKIFKANVDALLAYHPQKYLQKTKILFIKAKERDSYNPHTPEKGWQMLLGNNLLLFEMSGNHTSVLLEPHVTAVAALFDYYLRGSTKTETYHEEMLV